MEEIAKTNYKGKRLPILFDEKGNKFFVEFENTVCRLKYKEKDGAWDFYSTFVPPEHRNHGIARDIVRAGLEKSKEENVKIIPTCSFVEQYLEEHSEFQELVK